MDGVLHTARLELILLGPERAREVASGRNLNGHPWADGYPLGSTLLRAELTSAAAAQRRPLGAFGTYQLIRRADGHVIGDVGFMGRPTTRVPSRSAARSPRTHAARATPPRRSRRCSAGCAASRA